MHAKKVFKNAKIVFFWHFWHANAHCQINPSPLTFCTQVSVYIHISTHIIITITIGLQSGKLYRNIRQDWSWFGIDFMSRRDDIWIKLRCLSTAWRMKYLLAQELYTVCGANVSQINHYVTKFIR